MNKTFNNIYFYIIKIFPVFFSAFVLLQAAPTLAGCPKSLTGAYNGYARLQSDNSGIVTDVIDVVIHEVFNSTGTYSVDTYAAIDQHEYWIGTYNLNTTTCIGTIMPAFGLNLSQNQTDGAWRIVVSDSGNEIDMVLITPPLNGQNLRGHVHLIKQ